MKTSYLSPAFPYRIDSPFEQSGRGLALDGFLKHCELCQTGHTQGYFAWAPSSVGFVDRWLLLAAHGDVIEQDYLPDDAYFGGHTPAGILGRAMRRVGRRLFNRERHLS